MIKNLIKSYHLENIFAVMCRVIEVDYNTIDRTKDRWYSEYEWSEDVEDKFKEWMIDYIHKIPEAQRELYDKAYMRRSDCELAVSMFLLNYGWKTKR